MWRSWLAYLHGVQGVGSSSLLTPTKEEKALLLWQQGFFLYDKKEKAGHEVPVVEFRRDCKSLLLQFDEKLHYCTIAKQYACFFFLQTDNNTRRQNYIPGLFLFITTTHGSSRTKRSFVSNLLTPTKRKRSFCFDYSVTFSHHKKVKRGEINCTASVIGRGFTGYQTDTNIAGIVSIILQKAATGYLFPQPY